MRLRADLNRYEWLAVEDQEFVPSPMAGVERVLIDRVGDEVAVATSIVRYAPNSSFPRHEHALGEEFFVLAGVFSDEHGDYPAGTYVRNPAGTAHTPYSDPGCEIYVKLRQFDPNDQDQFAKQLDLSTPEEGVQMETLHEHGDELVVLIRSAAGERIVLPAHTCAREALVLEGAVAWQTDATRTLRRKSWLRVPPGSPLRLVAVEPSVVLAKTRPTAHG